MKTGGAVEYDPGQRAGFFTKTRTAHTPPPPTQVSEGFAATLRFENISAGY